MTKEEYCILQSESGIFSEQIDMLNRVQRCNGLDVKAVLTPFEFKMLDRFWGLLYEAHKDIRVCGFERLAFRDIHISTRELPPLVCGFETFK